MVITHNGKFNADDVFAAALLKIALGDHTEFKRLSSIPDDLDDEDVVYGFDEHNDDNVFPEFASFWDDLGPILVGPEQAEKFGQEFISKDNGTIELLIEYFNPNPDNADPDDPDLEEAFQNAMDWAEWALQNAIIHMQG